MSVPQLSIVRIDEAVDSPAARAQRLYAEAQSAAFEQIKALEDSLSAVVGFATEIADGGDVYPAGIRDLCRRLGEDLSQRAQTLDAITQRALEHRA